MSCKCLIIAALDGDQSHLRTLLPEEGGAWAQQESTPAQPVRPPTELEQGPVPAADLSTQAANVASVLLQPSEPFHPVDACRKLHMMFHDLQRIYKPQEVCRSSQFSAGVCVCV